MNKTRCVIKGMVYVLSIVAVVSSLGATEQLVSVFGDEGLATVDLSKGFATEYRVKRNGFLALYELVDEGKIAAVHGLSPEGYALYTANCAKRGHWDSGVLEECNDDVFNKLDSKVAYSIIENSLGECLEGSVVYAPFERDSGGKVDHGTTWFTTLEKFEWAKGIVAKILKEAGNAAAK